MNPTTVVVVEKAVVKLFPSSRKYITSMVGNSPVGSTEIVLCKKKIPRAGDEFVKVLRKRFAIRKAITAIMKRKIVNKAIVRIQ